MAAFYNVGMSVASASSLRMAKVKQRETAPELALRAGLRHAGLVGYRACHPGLPGKPDVAYTRWKVAIFVDGAFWHGHPSKFPEDKMSDYWKRKIARTRQRDEDATRRLRQEGWQVIRLWDFEVDTDVSACVSRVKNAIEIARSGRECGAQGEKPDAQARHSLSGAPQP